MSTVMHPVGPEPPRTYWVRRAVIIALVLIILVVVIAAIATAGNGAAATHGGSSRPSSLPTGPAGSLTPLPSDTASATAVETATTGKTSPSATPTSSTTSSSPATTRTTPRATTGRSATMKPSATPTKSIPSRTVPVVCDPAKLRATLTGRRTLKPKQRNEFSVSLINGSGATCIALVEAKNFELKVYSGTDRIWSSNDCAKLVKTRTEKLAAEQAIEWKMTWNGRRSKAGCGNRPEIPRAGTYFATAQLEGAKPVQLRMILRG